MFEHPSPGGKVIVAGQELVMLRKINRNTLGVKSLLKSYYGFFVSCFVLEVF